VIAWALRRLGWTAIGWACTAAAVLAVLAGARRAGRLAERADTARVTIQVQREQLAAAARRPGDRRELAGRLRDGSF
jgi:hypothetical protein